ncbi:MAG: hypothetical protein ACO1TE_02460, partial [Prosthecobacter sp.]
MTDLISRHEQNFEHAVWRVNFLSSLLQAHRSLAKRGKLWREKEAELVGRLGWAEKEMERLQDPGRPSPGRQVMRQG